MNIFMQLKMCFVIVTLQEIKQIRKNILTPRQVH